MASRFQRSKVAAVFDAMGGAERGHLVAGDFEALAARWTTRRGLVPGGVRCEHLRSVMFGWWASLSAAAANPDAVSLEDVLAVVDALPSMTEAVHATADAMFEAVDENDDGRISGPEYRQLIEAWNGRSTDTDAVFGLLDLDGDGFLSRDEFRALWTEFWAGDDPLAPGTWVFGRFEPTPADGPEPEPTGAGGLTGARSGWIGRGRNATVGVWRTRGWTSYCWPSGRTGI